MNKLDKENLNEPVTKGYLGEFTETVLLPAISALIDEKLKPISDDLQALTAKVTAHLELSDKRYLELKHRDTVIANWIKQIGDKTGVTIDLAELEKF